MSRFKYLFNFDRKEKYSNAEQMNCQPRAIIVDDETNSREILEKLLVIEGSVKVIAKCPNVSEALVATAIHKPDIVFLDIEMPNGTGFDYVEQLKPMGLNPEIIFVTAYNQYAITAIKHSAFDYLLKPVDIDDLTASIKRYRELVNKVDFSTKVDNLYKQLHEIGKVRFYTRAGIIFVDPRDIIWCQASGSYTIINLIGNKEEIVSITLKDVEDVLSKFSFFRASRSYLINLQYIAKVDKKNRNCTISFDGKTIDIPVSPAQLKIFD